MSTEAPSRVRLAKPWHKVSPSPIATWEGAGYPWA